MLGKCARGLVWGDLSINLSRRTASPSRKRCEYGTVDIGKTTAHIFKVVSLLGGELGARWSYRHLELQLYD